MVKLRQLQGLKTDIKNKRKKNITPGRKIKGSGEIGYHNKFSHDNLLRKVKHIIIQELLEFINKMLENIYKDNLGKGILIKKFLVMNHNQVKNAYVQYNQIFLNKTLKDIFSQDICGKYTNFPPEHNKNLINRLINEKNGKLKKLFLKLFNIKFIEVINHIKGKEEIRELKGLKNINQLIKKYKSEPDYLNNLKYFILNFEEIIQNKKKRIGRKIIKKIRIK